MKEASGFSEQDIDLVLAALREAQPSSNFEQRLLATVAQGAEIPQRRAWFWPVAVATAAVALCAGLAYHQARKQNAPTMVAVVPASVVAIQSHAVVAAKLQVSPLRAARFGRDDKGVWVSASVVATPTLSAADQTALDNTLAPSQMAPPAPLTAEERLLVRTARRNDQMNMAQLEAPPRFPARESQDEVVAQFVRRNLASMAFSEAFHPTPTEPPPPPVAQEPQSQSELAADTLQ